MISGRVLVVGSAIWQSFQVEGVDRYVIGDGFVEGDVVLYVCEYQRDKSLAKSFRSGSAFD